MIDLRHQEGTSQINGILLKAYLSPSVAIKLSAVRWILSLFGCVCISGSNVRSYWCPTGFGFHGH